MSTERLLRIAYRHRTAFLTGAAALVLLSIALLARMSFDTDVVRLAPRRGPAVRTFHRYLQHFGTFDHLYVVFEVPTGNRISDAEDLIDRYVSWQREPRGPVCRLYTRGWMTASSPDPVDELLLIQAQEGDRQAFEAIVRRWQRRLWTHAYRLTSSNDAAWDITQEAWIAIVKGLRKLRDPAKFRVWAYHIVSNKSMDYLKSRRRNDAASAATADSEQPPQERSAILRHLLDRLEPEKKLVLVLYYIEGLTLAELAFVLGVPEGTVKSRLHASRNAFRLLWQQHAGETQHER